MIDHRMTVRGFFKSVRCILAAGFCVFVISSGQARNEIRVWTSADGRQLEASLMELSNEGALLKLGNGREALVPLSRLSSKDREFLKSWEARGRLFVPNDLPDETEAPDEIEVAGGPERYLTPNFAFESGEPVSKAFISEAARIYEGTFAALNAIPHGLTFSPPEGSSHFRGSFMDDRQFDRVANEKMGSIPGQRVVGLYLGDEKRLLVPYSSLGAKRLGSRLTLRKRSDTTTLVHEIVHQVMHRYLPVLPTWFSEGIAEYVSVVPYQNGRFEFRNAERGLKDRLESEYRSSGRAVYEVIPPSAVLSFAGRSQARDLESVEVSSGSQESSPAQPWGGTVREYRDALLLVYFFMHLDQPEAEGAPVGKFLHRTHRALRESESILEEIEQYEKNRLSYNEEVQRFNDSIDEFEAAAAAYNQRIETYNTQAREGIPEAERIDVGNPPAEPTPPAGIEVPERLRKLSKEGGPIDLVRLIERRAISALIGNRSPEALDARMKEQFETIGIEIHYLNPG